MNSRFATAPVLFLALFVGASCASTSGVEVTLPEAKPDKGLVIFYRLNRARGSAMRFQVMDGSAAVVGNLSNGSVFHEFVEPGQQVFEVRAPSVDGRDSITLDVVAGQTYYVQGEILWGWPAGRPKFSLMSESQALTDLKL